MMGNEATYEQSVGVIDHADTDIKTYVTMACFFVSIYGILLLQATP